MIYYIDINITTIMQRNSKQSKGKYISNELADFLNLDRYCQINSLYDEGNTIVYWTSRGSRKQINWYDLTKSQLDSWGVKYHEIRVDKPYYDLFIDDKTLRIEEI